jgi:hypothetical protein
VASAPTLLESVSCARRESSDGTSFADGELQCRAELGAARTTAATTARRRALFTQN